MREQIVSFEIAKLAKELRFDWKVLDHFKHARDLNKIVSVPSYKHEFTYQVRNYNKSGLTTSRPTQSLLQKWLRDVHTVFVCPFIVSKATFNKMLERKNLEEKEYYEFVVKKGYEESGDWVDTFTVYGGSYEEALEKGLLAALKYLKPRVLWDKLGDIPVDEQECIEEEFEHFEVGTHRETIWHWFEEEFNLSVVKDLMELK